ncbi:hypothetical protein DICVIV_05604 [Dictyocaulus viviparus]|uniref:Uncharacterized protein n=1 Tax=Dictyocaulus viviparus TaxID=29172 RepID=A0A0D8XUW9_DICVI|nr:hypothetical protein DICVIV_05604 [Dictyocaulus viviparus]
MQELRVIFSIGQRSAAQSQCCRTAHNDKEQTCATKDRGHSVVVCCRSAPPNLSVYQQNHYICEIRSAKGAPKNPTKPKLIVLRDFASFFIFVGHGAH